MGKTWANIDPDGLNMKNTLPKSSPNDDAYSRRVEISKTILWSLIWGTAAYLVVIVVVLYLHW